MSGHSKWAKIKRQKAVVDSKKGAVYARMTREIMVAARAGGGDSARNFRLRQAVERAKAEGVPNDNIQRAIDKATGAAGADQLEELLYEGYGPSGVAIMVRCATNNRNRTAADLRNCFSKYGGNMGESGCVSWMFRERGQVNVLKSPQLNEDDLLLAALEAGADDVDTSSGDSIPITCAPAQLEKVRQALALAKFPVESAEITSAPITTIKVEDAANAKQLLKLLDAIEDQEDVQQVYTNFEMDDSLLSALAGSAV